MIRIIYNVSGTPAKAAEQAKAFFDALPDTMKQQAQAYAPRGAASGLPPSEEETLRETYLATFGKRFRLRNTQSPNDICDILRECIASGVDNSGATGASGDRGERFSDNIDLGDAAV